MRIYNAGIIVSQFVHILELITFIECSGSLYTLMVCLFIAICIRIAHLSHGGGLKKTKGTRKKAVDISI